MSQAELGIAISSLKKSKRETNYAIRTPKLLITSTDWLRRGKNSSSRVLCGPALAYGRDVFLRETLHYQWGACFRVDGKPTLLFSARPKVD